MVSQVADELSKDRFSLVKDLLTSEEKIRANGQKLVPHTVSEADNLVPDGAQTQSVEDEVKKVAALNHRSRLVAVGKNLSE